MAIEIGTKVAWTQTSSSRRSFSMLRREGKVQSLNETGSMATIKLRSGRTADIPVHWLSEEGQPTTLDTVATALRDNAVHAAPRS